MRNVYLFQPQYTTLVNGQLNGWLPYSIGAIWSYVSQFPDVTSEFQLKELFYKREPIDKVLERLENPALCGFSCYLWNRNYCLKLAEAIKRHWPACVIVFGGPEVNGKMIKYEFIDSIVTGEGEENFVDILRNIQQNKDPNLFFTKQRLPNLDIPSPYTLGLFDKIIQDNPDTVWAMTLETNRGCPYQCTFCDWGSLTYSKVKKFGLERIQEELEWLKNNPISYLYLADANFGIFKERDLEIARMIREATDNSTVDLVSVQNAKQSTEIAFKIGQVLGKKYAGVSVAMQSMDPHVLEEIKRKNLNTNNVEQLMKLSREYNIPTYTEMILGLPHETLETWKTGMTELLELGQHNSIEMWFCQLLENSELAQPESRKKYGINTICTPGYINLGTEQDYKEIAENTELICSTNTMPLEHTIESYMYGWMIIQMHVTGYSQIIAKYLRANQIGYRKFYDCLFERIKEDSFLTEHYQKLKQSVHYFLTTGMVDCNASGHMLHAFSSNYFYSNKRQLMDFIISVGNELITVPDGVRQLQHQFIYDKNNSTPVIIKCESDILNMLPTPVIYKVSTRVTSLDDNFLLALTRRRGLLKNYIKILDNDHN